MKKQYFTSRHDETARPADIAILHDPDNIRMALDTSIVSLNIGILPFLSIKRRLEEAVSDFISGLKFESAA